MSAAYLPRKREMETMTRRPGAERRFGLLVVVALGTLAGGSSHDSPCGAAAALPPMRNR